MNSPRCSTPTCQCRPVSWHQRKNSAIEPAYDLVVSSEPSRPSRTCRRNESASATTARSSSRTVQYRTPEGSLTGNALKSAPPPRSRPTVPSLTCTSTSHVHHNPVGVSHHRPPGQLMQRPATLGLPPENDAGR